MSIPFEPVLFGTKINIHLILEYLAFAVAFRYYIYLRKKSQDVISSQNRLSIILGAAAGALAGSRLVGLMENPVIPDFSLAGIIALLNVKSIMGGLFGGLIGVEVTKKIIGERHSSGDLFTFPILLGIIVGRVGCFLSGTNEFTYGSTTRFFTGMNLGDGALRHPTSLYELIFLFALFILLKKHQHLPATESGLLFKTFMICYFGFRFFIEFIKPNIFLIAGMSSIQWLCIICWIYYFPAIKIFLRYANQKIHLLRFHH